MFSRSFSSSTRFSPLEKKEENFIDKSIYVPLSFDLQKHRDSSSSKTRSELFNPWKDEAVSGFSLGEHTSSVGKDMDNHSRYSYSGPLVAAGVGQSNARKKFDESSTNTAKRTGLSKFSGLVASRTSNQSSRDDRRDTSKSSQYTINNHPGKFSGPFSDWDVSVKHDQNRHSQRISLACQEEEITQSRDSMVRTLHTYLHIIIIRKS